MDCKVSPMRKKLLSAATALIAICSASVAIAEEDDFVENTAVLNWDPYTHQNYTGDVALDRAFAYDRALCQEMLKGEHRKSSYKTAANGKKDFSSSSNEQKRITTSNQNGTTTQSRKRTEVAGRDEFFDCLEARGWINHRDPEWHDGVANWRTPEENAVFQHGRILDKAANGYIVYQTEKGPAVWTYERPEPLPGVQLTTKTAPITDFEADHTGQTLIPGYKAEYKFPYSAQQATDPTYTNVSPNAESFAQDEADYNNDYNKHYGRDISVPVTSTAPERTPYN